MTTSTSPDLPQQISSYLSDLDGGNTTVTASGNSKTLVTVWAGIEEIFTILEAAVTSTPANPASVAIPGVRAMLATLATALPWLIAADSTDQNRPDFVLFKLPAANALPDSPRMSNTNPLFVSTFQNMTTVFNDGLNGIAQRLNRTTVFALDAQSLFDDLHADPSLVSCALSVQRARLTVLVVQSD